MEGMVMITRTARAVLIFTIVIFTPAWAGAAECDSFYAEWEGYTQSRRSCRHAFITDPDCAYAKHFVDSGGNKAVFKENCLEGIVAACVSYELDPKYSDSDLNFEYTHNLPGGYDALQGYIRDSIPSGIPLPVHRKKFMSPAVKCLLTMKHYYNELRRNNHSDLARVIGNGILIGHRVYMYRKRGTYEEEREKWERRANMFLKRNPKWGEKYIDSPEEGISIPYPNPFMLAGISRIELERAEIIAKNVIAGVFKGKNANQLNAGKRNNPYPWTWDYDALKCPHCSEIIEVPEYWNSEARCTALLDIYPVAVRCFHKKEHAQYCLAGAVKHYLSWVPDLDPDIIYIPHTLENEAVTPNRLVALFNSKVKSFAKILSNVNEPFPRVKTNKYSERVAFLNQLVDMLEQHGDVAVARMIKRGMDQRIREGIHRPILEDDGGDFLKKEEQASTNAVSSDGGMLGGTPGNGMKPEKQSESGKEPDTAEKTEPTGTPSLPWILGILALLSALIVSVIVIRRW